MFHPPRREQIIDFGKQNIHVLANAITELTTGTPHVVEPGKKIIPDFPVQADSTLQHLPTALSANSLTSPSSCHPSPSFAHMQCP